jgi:hypothetical protein
MAPSKKGAPISREVTYVLCAAIAAYALYGGRQAGMLPVGAGWRFFSWHPFLMTASISLSTVNSSHLASVLDLVFAIVCITN